MSFNAKSVLISALSFVVFLILDILDCVLAVEFRLLDILFEGRRENMSRWSDCGCDSCAEWMNDHNKLHVFQLPQANNSFEDISKTSSKNVLFLHGMFSTSSVWTESVFPNLSDSIKQTHRIFAVDLLGFGRSPKPINCSYTLDENIEMIEQSVIRQFRLKSLHLVAHSMGCMIAIALAAKLPRCVKSVTLVAPPVFLGEESESEEVRKVVAGEKLWPPSQFLFAILGRHEHIGRLIFAIFCRNHRIWEGLWKTVFWKSKLHVEIPDIARYSHHCLWRTMHNLICGGSKFMKTYLQVLSETQVQIYVLHGDQDQVIPVKCSNNVKIVAPTAQLDIITHGDHSSIIHERIHDFTTYIEHIWEACS